MSLPGGFFTSLLTIHKFEGSTRQLYIAVVKVREALGNRTLSRPPGNILLAFSLVCR